MADTAITAAPTTTASPVNAPTRSGRVFTGDWGIRSASTSPSSAKRWTSQQVRWKASTSAGETTYNTHALNLDTTSFTLTLDRSKFYPATDKKLNSVTIQVRGKNGKGEGSWAGATLKLATPARPTVSAAFDPDTGVLSYNVTAAADDESADRYDTEWKAVIKVVDKDGKTSTVRDKTGSFTGDAQAFTYQYKAANAMTYAMRCVLTLQARSRGFHGASSWVTTTKVVALPAIPAIKSRSIVGKDANKRQVFSIETNRSDNHPTEAVKLQRLGGVPDGTTQNQAELLTGWADVEDALDDGRCTGLTDLWANAITADGCKTWYRVAATACGSTMYSKPYVCDTPFTPTPTAEGDTCAIVSVLSKIDGANVADDQLEVVVGFKGTDGADGTELTWADDERAWESSAPPSPMLVTARDAKSKSTKWSATSTVVLANLTPGSKYWVKARRYLGDGEARTFGAFAKVKSAVVDVDDATNDKCEVLEVATSKTDQSIPVGTARVRIGWKTNDGSQGTEVSWSAFESAWHSNERPTTADVEWTNSIPIAHGSWTGTATLWVRGLEAGTKHYFKARRYSVSNNARTYGAYCKKKSATTAALGNAEVQTASGDKCAIVKVLTNADDRAIPPDTLKVYVGYSNDGDDGTEIAWSDFSNAWSASSGYQSMRQAADNANNTAKAAGWAAGCVAYLRGLEVGKDYTIRARRYLEAPAQTFGSWSDKVHEAPVDVPDNVAIHVPSMVAAGQNIRVSWDFDSASAQSSYAVTYTVERPDGTFDKPVTFEKKTSARSVNFAASRFAGAAAVRFSVSVACGGAVMATSQTETTAVVAAPTCALAVARNAAGKVQSGIVGMTVTGNAGDAYRAVVKSRGCSKSMPYGSLRQGADEIVYSTSGTIPDGGQAAITTPVLPLVDGARYYAQAWTENAMGAVSVRRAVSFGVDYATKAKPAESTCQMADGALRIAIAKPEGGRDTDTVSIYRVSADGAWLIAEGCQYGTAWVDPYPPYSIDGEQAYRLLTTTEDGETEWAEFGFENAAKVATFDWQDGFGKHTLAIDYDISADYSFDKGFEAREHLDGSFEGYWGEAVRMRIGMRCALLDDDDERMALLVLLAQHSGAVFARLADGTAIPADVEVAFGDTYASRKTPVTLTLTRVGLAGEFEASEA